jgi:hypothetical protein
MRTGLASSHAIGLNQVVDDPMAAGIAGAAALLIAFALFSVSSWLMAAFGGSAAYAAACIFIASFPANPKSHDQSRRILEIWLRHVAASGVVFSAVLLASQMSDAPKAFFCAGAVPWSPTIFAVGAFVLAIMAALNRRQGKSGLVHVVWIGVDWIAPWYGFFSVATVTGAGLALGCDDRAASDYALLAVFGTAASIAGTWLGRWLGDGLPTQPINPYEDL